MKVIIPAAGKGTRFAPFSTAVPKEMLPILGRPIVDYVLEELALAGYEHIVAVVSDTKKTLEDYIAHHWLNRQDSQKATVAFARQFKANGLGHAVWTARMYCNEPLVAVLLPDNIFFGGTQPLTEMYEIAKTHNASVVAVEEVPRPLVSKYGIIDTGEQLADNCFRIRDIIEKPEPNNTPSQLAVVGRYILSTKIFDILETTQKDANGEIQLTDAIKTLCQTNYPVYSYKIKSQFLDVGTPNSWLHANVTIANKEYAKISQK